MESDFDLILKAFSFQGPALVGLVSAAKLNSLYISSFLRLKFLVVLTIPLLIFEKASRTCFDTFKANKAVRTKYIIPIIFCLGDKLFPAIGVL